MKPFCTKSILYFTLALLVVGAAACTQSKPAVPTPTLIPLANETLVVPEGNVTPSAPGQETLVPAPGEATPLAPVEGQPTLIIPPAEGQPTPIIATEPTLLPTPTIVGDTGQPAPATPPAGGENPPTGATGSCPNPYTVQPGEWFYAIARKCGVSAQALIAANPGLNPNILRPGQTINIPGGGSPPSVQPTAESGGEPPPSAGSCPNPYTIQRGDTLFSIARKCGTTVAAIQQANGIPSPDYIFPGQQIRIP